MQYFLDLQKLNKSRVCADAGLLDENILEQSLLFFSGVAKMLLECLLGKDSTFEVINFGEPLASNVIETIEAKLATKSDIFAALPEWFLDDLTELLLFTLQ